MYYNNGNTSAASIICPNGLARDGYTWRGWSSNTNTNPDADVVYNVDSVVNILEDSVFYGLYKSTVILSYNNNNGSGTMAEQHGEKYYNAYGTYKYPQFVLADNTFTRANCTFISWRLGSVDGNEYSPGSTVDLTENTTFYVKWQQVLSGSAYYNVDANHGSGETYTYTFSHPFKTPPAIDYSKSSIDGDITTSIYNITTTSFTARFVHSKSSGQGCSFVWSATGEPA